MSQSETIPESLLEMVDQSMEKYAKENHKAVWRIAKEAAMYGFRVGYFLSQLSVKAERIQQTKQRGDNNEL